MLDSEITGGIGSEKKEVKETRAWGGSDWREEARIEKKTMEEKWKMMKRAENGWRGTNLEDDPSGLFESNHQDRANYVKYDERLRGKVDEFLNRANVLGEAIEKDPHKWMALIREVKSAGNDTIRLKSDYGLESGGLDIKRVYWINEGLIPTLIKMESTFDKEGGADIAIDALADYVKEEFNPYSDNSDSLVEEILISIINMGRVNGAKKASELIKLFENVQIKAYEEQSRDVDWSEPEIFWKDQYLNGYEPDLVWNDNSLRFFHYAWSRAITHDTNWSDEQKKSLTVIASELLNINSYGSVVNYTELFSYLGVDASIPILLENLKNENTLVRRMSAEILCRMELGRIWIKDQNEEGVKYFDKVYQLFKQNDPDFWVNLFRKGGGFVQRMDNHGRVAVCDGEGLVLGSFDLNLEAKENNIRAEVTEVTSKDVFLAKADETDEQRSLRESMAKKFLSEYGELYKEIEDKTKVRLNSLELHEQGWFVMTYEQGDEEMKENLEKVAREFGDLGLKAFLAADYGGSTEDILNYLKSEGTSHEQKENMLRNFNRIVTSSYGWRKIFEVVDGNSDHKVAPEVHEVLIRKACEYLIAATLIDKGEGGEITHKDLLESMETIAWALEEVKGIGDPNSALVLSEKPTVRTEYLDSEKTQESPGVAMTWRLENTKTGAVIFITQRAKKTYGEKGKEGGGGQARININVVNRPMGRFVRLGVDADDYLGEPKVTFDLGTGLPKNQSPEDDMVYPTVRVSKVLKSVPGSEGGHTTASFSKESSVRFEEYSWAFRNWMIETFKNRKAY